MRRFHNEGHHGLGARRVIDGRRIAPPSSSNPEHDAVWQLSYLRPRLDVWCPASASGTGLMAPRYTSIVAETRLACLRRRDACGHTGCAGVSDTNHCSHRHDLVLRASFTAVPFALSLRIVRQDISVVAIASIFPRTCANTIGLIWADGIGDFIYIRGYVFNLADVAILLDPVTGTIGSARMLWRWASQRRHVDS